MKNILLTGGAGYIGSHVAHLLIDKGYAVTVIDSLITGKLSNIPKKSTIPNNAKIVIRLGITIFLNANVGTLLINKNEIIIKNIGTTMS